MMGAGRRTAMIERALAGGLLAVVAGLGLPAVAGAAGETTPSASSIILNLTNRPLESRERAFSEDIKRDALTLGPSAIDEWEPHPDGAIRNRTNGVSNTA